ncbi:collagen-like protein [Flagellimonas pacifica]|uniref:Collagen-like protein n=1 Tax=Flagellimonas pacifica TaxID=1247520 RepID=A0A285MUQ3_9FLAO|nr:collagen-like protein [Allomuricauda parva]SNZ00905.1 hypothetical protein SAMN06265377_2732 [Allomuricauda parva]
MKLKRLLVLGCMAIAVAFVSCSKGDAGEQGLKGDPGESIKGDKGDKGDTGNTGDDGDSAYEIAVAEGFEGTEAEWLESLNGEDGEDGDDGDSAYEIAVAEGFEGTEAEWLESLNGAPGEDDQDGNANVLYHDVDLSDIGSTSAITVNLFEEMEGVNEVEDFTKHAFFYYLTDSADRIWSTPGVYVITITSARLYIGGELLGHLRIQFFDYNGNPQTVSNLDNLRIVAVELPGLGAKNSENDLMARLKAAGVDTGDYHAMATYFGIEE